MEKWITFGVDDRPLFQILSREWVLAGRKRKSEQRRTDDGRAQRRAETERRKAKYPGLIEHYKATRRSLERGADGSHTLAEWRAVVAAHGGACAYCKRTDLPLTRDHVQPISRGGTSYIDNIVPACRSCNSRKGAR